MLNVLIAIAVACWIAGFFVNGFCFYNVVLLVPTVLFAARKFGIHVKLSNIITCEALFLFFSITFRLLFHHFSWVPFLLSILIRAIFIIVCVYDDTVYVYVNEERKKI